MKKYIDANKKLHIQVYDGMHEEYTTVVKTIAEILDCYTDEGCPEAADVEKVKHGKWKEIEYATSLYSIVSMRCNKCGRYHNEVFTYGNPTEFIRYCPNCGAKMDEKENKNERN